MSFTIVKLAGLSAVLVLVLRFRRRRMTYTNQNIEQLLAASDPVTRASNLTQHTDSLLQASARLSQALSGDAR